MVDLIEFLRARLGEEDAEAEAAKATGSWAWIGCDLSNRSDVSADFITTWSPTRVLAEVAAKRRILEAHSPAPEGYLQHGDGRACRSCKSERIIGHRRESLPVRIPCGTLKLLAQPYDWHPDFDPSWRSP